MKILVAIANYGTGNDVYLSQVLQEFRKIRHHVDIIVNTNIPKSLGPDVEVIVGFPAKDPRSLPFAHKQLFAERSEFYDLFIYTEDDTPITESNVDSFLRVTEVLRKDEIAGFLRTETSPDGKVYFPEVHNHFHWDPGSLCTRGGHKFAYYTDEHAGCYMLTKEQLRNCVASGGFLTTFYEAEYPPLETAATDPYTRCGLRKMMCVSSLEEFVVPHLSNKYAGNGIIVPGEDFYLQLDALLRLGENGKPRTTLFPVETKLFHRHWSKRYYEPCQDRLIELIPKSAHKILSIGCGWGVTEKSLVDQGLRVKAIPMDSVIAACAEARGIEVVHGDSKTAAEGLSTERFDCILIPNALHLVCDPAGFLMPYVALLAPGGCVIASVPNISWVRRLARRRRFGKNANPKDYSSSGMHVSTANALRRWFKKAGLKPDSISYEIVENEKKRINRLSLGLAESILGSDVYISASAPTGRS